jgi:hypothetical protein
LEVTTETAASGIGLQRQRPRQHHDSHSAMSNIEESAPKESKTIVVKQHLVLTHYQIGDVDIATVLLTMFSNCLVSDTSNQ